MAGTESVSFRLLTEKLVQLDKYADREHRTRANLLQVIVEEWLRQAEQEVELTNG